MASKKNNNFRASFGNAFYGFKSALQTERNMKIHFLAASLVIVAGFLFRISTIEWFIVLILINMVIVAELLNTAIECSVDLASPEKHDLARKAKDISASAVLTTAVCAAIIGGFIFFPKVLAFLH